MKAAEAKKHLLGRWQECRNQLDALFYYAEEEDLKKRLPGKGQWSVTEVLFHINLVNGAYLRNMPSLDRLADAQAQRDLKRSFLGKQIEKSMALKADGGMRFKMKTPSVSDPIKAQARGHAAVENVIFREILQDLESIKSYIEILDVKNLDAHRVATLFPILKINGADVPFVLLEHELRHLAQAKRIVEA